MAALALFLLATLCVDVNARPHIISIIQDDMGYYDSGLHNVEAEAWTQNITQLAREGIILTNHYSHWHCSPTRRSFLTGRLPVHHGEQLSSNAGDDIDLRMTWVSQKLQNAGYVTHWYLDSNPYTSPNNLYLSAHNSFLITPKVR
jgi:arylsulfatase A-like enzyme